MRTNINPPVPSAPLRGAEAEVNESGINVDALRSELRRIAEAKLDHEFAAPYWECAYYCRNQEGADPHGTCSFGCHDEPVCMTGGPWTEEDMEEYYTARYEWEDAPEMVLNLLDEFDAVLQRAASDGRRCKG
jgi:hypothetical protein